MRRLFNFVLVFVMVAGAAYTFNTKRLAVNASADLREIEAQIRAEHETIDLLKADWSLLTQPDRLQDLTERYAESLQLKPIVVEQILTPAELPNRPIDLSPFDDGSALGGMPGATRPISSNPATSSSECGHANARDDLSRKV